MTRRPHLRDLGITIGKLPTGPLNAITDVAGVRVGHTTVIHGDGPLEAGVGPSRTGVTAIHPHAGSVFQAMVPAAIEVLNGAGEITGRSQIDEYGLLESPILITNTLSVGTAHRACVDWIAARESSLGTDAFSIPVVAETFDGYLNDIVGQHVTEQHVHAALDSATGGPVAEGNVGGGTGMRLFQFKGGIGTSSRIVHIDGQEFTVGVLVQGNYGMRQDLLVKGVPVGSLWDAEPIAPPERDGSVIVVIATDAPLSDRQLKRLTKRGSLGLALTGGIARHMSGDILIAFSNPEVNRVDRRDTGLIRTTEQIRDSRIDPFFVATVEATEEAVLNAMIAAETMTGRDGNKVEGIDHDQLVAILQRYGQAG